MARKYFADVPKEKAEADLELFSPPPPPVEPTWVDFTDNQPAPVISDGAEVPPQPADVDLAPMPAEAMAVPTETAPEPVEPASPPDESSLAPVDETMAEEEPAERRGFFGRLLRRENNG